MISRKQISLITFIVAVASRAVVFAHWISSPLRYYGSVPGLDMETLLRFSDYGKYPVLFIPYRLLLVTIRLLCGGNCEPSIVVLVQMITGIIGAVIVADIVLITYRSRLAALTGGLISAIYAPYLLHECLVLQEIFTMNIFLVAFYLMLDLFRGRRNYIRVAMAGIVMAFSITGRPAYVLCAVTMIIMILRRAIQKGQGGKPLIFLISMTCALCCFATISYFCAGTTNVFQTSYSYLVSDNVMSAGIVTRSGVDVALSIAKSVYKRIPYVFSATEIAENVNYYFFAEKIAALRFLLRPEGVFPLAVIALIMMSWKRKCNFVIALSLAVIATTGLSICARFPVARYRLLICPYVIMIASYLAVVVTKAKTYDWIMLTGALALVLPIWFMNSPKIKMRDSDYVSWGIACEKCDRIDEAVENYKTAWRRYASRPAAVRLFNHMVRGGLKLEALEFTQCYLATRGHDDLFELYYAMALLANSRTDEAKKVLANLKTNDESIINRRRLLMEGIDEQR